MGTMKKKVRTLALMCCLTMSSKAQVTLHLSSKASTQTPASGRGNGLRLTGHVFGEIVMEYFKIVMEYFTKLALTPMIRRF